MTAPTDYPESPAARTRWIESLRLKAPPKNRLDPWTPYAFIREEECGPDGRLLPTATLFLTNRECPYRCLMCDLWANTLDATVPPGAISAQIRHALERLADSPPPAAPGPTDGEFALLARGSGGGAASTVPPSIPPELGRGRAPLRQIKLYNAGSFFDPKAIPPDDYAEIARTVETFERVIVESHPALVGRRTLQFAGILDGDLEVAIGLETVHPETLDRLNKRFTVDDFRRATDLLAQNRIGLRVFLLLRPPYMSEREGLEWVMRSLDTAFEAGAEVCCVIPTRAGNGAMDHLLARGHFEPPRLASLESAVEYGIALKRGRVFADLWDGERLCSCTCSQARLRRLAAMNRTQAIPPPVLCDLC